MIQTSAVLLLLFAADAARADEVAECSTVLARLKPSQRIEQLEQETLICTRDLRLAQKEDRDCNDALTDKKRLAGLCDNELSQIKEKLTLGDNRRLILEEEARDRQKYLDGLHGKYELISTAIIIGLLLLVPLNILLAIGMIIAYLKYRKFFGPKRTV